MTVAIALVLVVLVTATGARAEDGLAARHPLRLSIDELLYSLESPPPSEAPVEAPLTSKVLGSLGNRPLGLRPLLTLVPTESREGDNAKPPAFALVAHPEGRTIVSVTRPGTKVGPGDSVVFQRLLVSDLFKGRRVSLTVYEDSALDERTLRFLGLGARLRAMPAFEVLGWRLRFQIFGSYHPDYGGTGYFAIGGEHSAPPMPVPQALE